MRSTKFYRNIQEIGIDNVSSPPPDDLSLNFESVFKGLKIVQIAPNRLNQFRDKKSNKSYKEMLDDVYSHFRTLEVLKDVFKTSINFKKIDLVQKHYDKVQKEIDTLEKKVKEEHVRDIHLKISIDKNRPIIMRK